MSIDGSVTYEQALMQLDATLRSLEEGKLSLEEAIAAVARGREYLELCERKLEEARHRIESLPVREEPAADDEPPHPATVAHNPKIGLCRKHSALWKFRNRDI